MKKLFFTLGITILILAGCQSVMNNQTSPPNVEVTSGSEVTIANSQTKPSSDSTNSIETNSSTSANNGDSSISGNSSATNDNTVGLKNVKVDSNNNELTPSQKSVIEYFDNDYFYISNDEGYEFLQRYPLVFKDSQINIIGKVEKLSVIPTINIRSSLTLLIPRKCFMLGTGIWTMNPI